MLQLLLVPGRARAPLPANIISYELTPSGAATAMTLVLSRVSGTIRFDVPGEFTFNTNSSTGVNVPITIPAAATRMYITPVLAGTGTAASAVLLSATVAQNDRVVGIEQWGNIDPVIGIRMRLCRNLVRVPDNGPLSPVWTGLFQGCVNFNFNISTWNVDHVTQISSMFNGATIFNQNLSNLTFPLLPVGGRLNYDASTPAWLTQNKPNFANK